MSDILIIGAGAVGCATAMELVQRGANVTLVDRAEAGKEASWAGGGILFPLLPWKYREEVNRLAQAGMADYPAMIEELLTTGIDPEYVVSGMLVHPPFELETARRWCTTHGMQAELQDDKLWLPQVSQVRNPRLLQAMRCWLENRGVRFIEHSEVSALEVEAGRITAVRAAELSLQADHYILASGAWSRLLLGDYAVKRQLKPMRGQMLLYEMPAGTLQQIHYWSDFYLVPRRDGHILAGSTVEDVGFDKSTTASAAHELAEKATRLLPALADTAPVRHWAGLRPGSPDNIPLIGRHPALENLWLNTGHFRYGVTMAPASAKLLANLLAGETPFLDVSAYRP